MQRELHHFQYMLLTFGLKVKMTTILHLKAVVIKILQVNLQWKKTQFIGKVEQRNAMILLNFLQKRPPPQQEWLRSFWKNHQRQTSLTKRWQMRKFFLISTFSYINVPTKTSLSYCQVSIGQLTIRCRNLKKSSSICYHALKTIIKTVKHDESGKTKWQQLRS